jgi:hypothetical protein
VGYFAGPTLVVIGISKLVANIGAAILITFPSFCIERDKSYHAINLAKNAIRAAHVILWGVYSLILFTSLISVYAFKHMEIKEENKDMVVKYRHPYIVFN